MSRWLKFLLLGLVVAGTGLVFLPWWLGAALRPVLKAQGVTFARYERTGYAHFRLLDVQYAIPGFNLTAGQVQTLTPLAWLGQRLRGVEPGVMVADWRVERMASPGLVPETVGAGLPRDGLRQSRPKAVPTTTESGSPVRPTLSGLPDLQAALRRIGPRVSYWLPRAHLSSGELRGFGPAVTIAQADWQNATLSVEGLRVADQVVALVLAPAPDGSVSLTAHTAANEARLHLVWSGMEIKGEAALWDQPAQLSSRFSTTGWLPDEASLVADNWRLPAARVKLGVPYAQVIGSGRLDWRDGAFALSLNARAEPVADTKAPPFAASATAQGTLRELTLTALQVDAPFATARLSAPIIFSLDHPPAGESAQLSMQADLAKMPWFKAQGTAEGTVTVSGHDAAARQEFKMEFAHVVVPGFALKAAQARGVLAWPRLELSELTVQFDDASSLAARGAINCQTRELTGVALTAKLAPASFARWLPPGVQWEKAELKATAEGPLGAPRHQGSLALSAVQWPPLHPIAVEATWRGEGTKLDVSATTKAGSSTLEFAGTLEPHGLRLEKFAFAPAGRPVWQLAAPASVTWAPFWRVDRLQLAGPDSQLTFTGQGGAEGWFELTATRFDSTWLQDWVALTGPGWQLNSLHTTGHVAGGGLDFATELAAQIEMSPRPAQVKLVASGDAQGVRLKELKVVEGERVLTQATGRLPLTLALSPAPHLLFDDDGTFELAATTQPDSPLWAALSAVTGLELTKPEATLNLQGTLRLPSGNLELKLARLGVDPGRYKFPLPDFAELGLSLQFDREKITVTTFSAQLDGQAVQGAGQLPMSEGNWQQLWRTPSALDWSRAEARVEIPDADLAAVSRRFPSPAALRHPAGDPGRPRVRQPHDHGAKTDRHPRG